MARLNRPILGLLCCVAAIASGESSAPTHVKLPNPGTEKYWAYQPVRRNPAPAVRDDAWPHNDIDRFILARLESRGLHPVADADPTTLLRRLYFDLAGLPPTPEQIDAFLKDSSPDRYENLVDRLLASPQFGERWGRHWLDVARYGESLTLRGFLLKDAWRYRDYVIDTFNRDRPYNQFIREQVSGDLMPAQSLEDRRRQLIATEFLTLGNTNLEEQDKKQLEMDVVDEQINTLGAAFLGQTIGCARCHDHKFDPISTSDYYALAGILHSTQTLEHANVSKNIEVALPVDPQRDAVLKKQELAVGELQLQIAEAKAALVSASAKGNAAGTGSVIAVADLPGIIIDDAAAMQVGTWKKSTTLKSYIGEGYLVAEGPHTEAKSLTFKPDLSESGKYEVRFAYTPGANRATNLQVSVFSADGEVTVAINEQTPPPIYGHFISLGQHNFERGSQGYVLISADGADGSVIADAVQFLPAEMVAATRPAGAADATTAPSDATKARPTAAQVKAMEAQLKKMVADGPKRDVVLSVRESKQIGDVPIHIRGSVHSLGEIVPRGFLHVVPVSQWPQIPKGESGRVELGDWLANPQNPLPARVMANRSWHWLFGVGIVRTVDNFGTTGELPSHPELLDYLASRFVEQNWSVKSLVREIVLSHTYQLSTADDKAAMSADTENRLVWRMNRRRLDAECIRDGILAISGELTPDAGGPTYKPGLSADFGYKQTGNCRSVYLPIFRNALPEIFTVFDFADPSVSTGRRNVSTVAPQSLFMLNSPFVIEQSKAAAERLLSDRNLPDDAVRVAQAYELTLGRRPTEPEAATVLEYLKQSSPHDAWPGIFHALFASMEFRYVN